ncbi:TonB-dependent siderophore receptor [Chlorogloeopsis sp. ULAP01]|uniref:TonB-dependent siderophore receptor n=1 Tax=Chlorogloeopsis sp. ULAP01 TaxID=3056483 RepID=UPI0025AA557C|nr:TonB-dependent siderophore receptor [Chlorogloeopsis sp. ULAP01]MDM9379411.1 TonB-dependent siderophore receptor [Chlorogloeopsis sp. ULAP01]
MKQRLFFYLGIVGAIYLLGIQPVKAHREEMLATERTSNTEIIQLSEFQIPYTSVKDWLAQSEVIQVTGVRLSSTANGLEIILETSASNNLQTTTKSEGNNFIADIPNTQLRLPTGNSFRQDKPVAGIAEVTVTNLDANTIRVTVTGEAGAPKVELFDDDKGLVFGITPAQSPTPQQPPAQTPDTVQPESKTPPEQPSAQDDQPIELMVTGEQEGEYNVQSAPSSTKIDVPLRDVPQSIQVVPRQVLEDRQVTRLDEFTDNVSGVQRIFGFGTASGYNIRGFFAGYENLRNGFRNLGNPRDIANIERVEVLKGPTSVLYGGGSAFSLSGLVNTVTKKPLDNPFYQGNFTAGSFDFYRPSIDINVPLLPDRSALSRLNVAYENANSYRDFVNKENFFIAPVLTLQVSPQTTFTTEFEYLDYSFIFDKGFPLVPESLKLPRNRFLGEPGLDPTTGNVSSITGDLEHKFSENWKFRQGVNVTINNVEVGNARLYRISLQDDRRTLNRTSSQGAQKSESYTSQSEISGKFNTGSLRHNVLLGVELSRFKYGYDVFEAPLAPIDIFNPIYGARPGEFTLSFAGEQGGDNIGVYLQDLIEILPNLKVLAGGRFDVVDSFYKDRPTNTVLNEQTDSRFSPRIGIVYQPSHFTSLYFNWTNSFVPQIFSRSRTGEQFKPEIGEQFEFGIKQNFFDNRLSANLAFYQITRQNVLTADPIDPNFSVQTGEQRSRGIELDIAGEILPGWKIIATYSYTDAVVTEDNNPNLIGDRTAGVPEHSASLWTTYEIQKGNLQGLGFGLGLVYAGEREVSLPNTFTVPSYLRTDASIFYRRSNYRIGLNFKNLFDVKYYEVDGFSLLPAAPLTVLGAVAVEF